MKKFKASNWYRPEIEEVEIIRETAKSVFRIDTSWRQAKERREAKESGREKYCDTWAEARDYLLALAVGRCESTRKAFESAENVRDSVEMWTDPS